MSEGGIDPAAAPVLTSINPILTYTGHNQPNTPAVNSA